MNLNPILLLDYSSHAEDHFAFEKVMARFYVIEDNTWMQDKLTTKMCIYYRVASYQDLFSFIHVHLK